MEFRESIGVSNFQPMNLQQYPVWLSNQNYIGVYEGGSWQNYNINDLSSIMPEAGSPTYWFSATQKAGLENAWVCDGNIYCVDFDAASLSDDATANQALLEAGITKITADTVTAGCFSERLQKWFFAAGDKVLVSNTDSLKGGFTEKVFPSNVPFDRCFDDGQSVVFALTGSGNSVTNFSVDGEDWRFRLYSKTEITITSAERTDAASPRINGIQVLPASFLIPPILTAKVFFLLFITIGDMRYLESQTLIHQKPAPEI